MDYGISSEKHLRGNQAVINVATPKIEELGGEFGVRFIPCHIVTTHSPPYNSKYSDQTPNLSVTIFVGVKEIQQIGYGNETDYFSIRANSIINGKHTLEQTELLVGWSLDQYSDLPIEIHEFSDRLGKFRAAMIEKYGSPMN